MNYAITFVAPRRIAARIAERLRLTAQPREHYLAGAGNHTDLEQRMRHWESQQQRAAGLCVGS